MPRSISCVTFSAAAILATFSTIASETNLPEPPVERRSAENARVLLEADWRLQLGSMSLVVAIRDELARIERILQRQVRALQPKEVQTRRAEFAVIQRLVEGAPGADSEDVYLSLRRFKRRLLLDDPQIDFNRLVCIDVGYSGSGHQTLHRSAAYAASGGRLLLLDGLGPDAAVRKLAPQETGGASFWRPDVSYDGTKVVFCMKPTPEGAFHLYEAHLDGSGCRQITRGSYDDLDPIYTPDGHIVFTTTRCNQFLPCGGSHYRMHILARCDMLGKNLYFLSANHETDYLPTVLSSGQLLFTRWEYYDKSVSRVHSLWRCNPDGTGINVVWGNQSTWPDIVWHARPIPETHDILFCSGGHHTAFSGSLGIVRPSEGMNYPDGLYTLTPDVPWAEVGGGPEDHAYRPDYPPPKCYVGYQTPFPISRDLLLVSARTGQSTDFRKETDRRWHDLYLMDYDGNMELLYRGTYNILHAQPVRERVKPPVIPSSVKWPGRMTKADQQSEFGILFSSDVYQGTAIPRGSVKALRVLDAECRTFSNCRGLRNTPGLGDAYRRRGAFPRIDIVGETPVSFVYADAPKRILGTVPVEEDGSVCFKVPPLRALYFQLLDNRGRCLQTMRSMVHVMPGERRGCVGCHQTDTISPMPKTRLALGRRPHDLHPPPWGDVTVSFPRFVQPILDRHCAACHSGKEADAEPNLAHRAEDPTDFSWPYVKLLFGNNPSTPQDRPETSIAGPIFTSTAYENSAVKYPTRETVVPPMTAMSYRSRLIQIATSGEHHNVKVSPEEEARLVAWVDALCPYNGLEELLTRPDPNPALNARFSYPARMRTAPVVHKAFCQDGFDSQDDRLPKDENGRVLPSMSLVNGKRVYRIPQIDEEVSDPSPAKGK